MTEWTMENPQVKGAYNEGRDERVTSNDKMRAALEAAKNELYDITESEELTAAQTALFKQIDEALKSWPVDIEQAKDVAFHAGYKQREKEDHLFDAQTVQEVLYKAIPELRLKNQILQLPDQIKEQQLLMTKRTAEIEEQRLELDKIKNGHKEFVLSAKEGDKPKFGNDKARDLAVAMLLQDDKAYNDLLDSTRNKERLQRLDEIELKHLEDLFKAYLTVAGMTGAR